MSRAYQRRGYKDHQITARLVSRSGPQSVRAAFECLYFAWWHRYYRMQVTTPRSEVERQIYLGYHHYYMQYTKQCDRPRLP